MQGFVYFIQSGDQGPLKIGWAMQPSKRLKELQTGNPQKLRLLSTLAGSLRDEGAWHEWFKAHRITGEWFQPCQCVFNTIFNATRSGEEAAYIEPGGVAMDLTCKPLKIPHFEGAIAAPPGWGSGLCCGEGWTNEDRARVREELV